MPNLNVPFVLLSRFLSYVINLVIGAGDIPPAPGQSTTWTKRIKR
ncbi:MAG TPA: hypothetical protein VGT61_15465 [Thermomicrobiales bacterium]|jgi:hypothetical protein|nr:hypothetical protein [Thermomicrobiales bacterium]